MALFQEVKNGRNRYVAEIQALSQDLAEMKERIKILNNEVEILRNESQEKSRTLIDTRHQVQKEINERDSLRNELDKLERFFKDKLSTID